MSHRRAGGSLKRNAFNAQVMFSNLDRLPFDGAFGSLKLETLLAS
jgi:hypothetical protein